MNDPDPMPKDFGLKWVLWMAWSNAITILAVIQGAFASILLLSDDGPDAMITHAQFRSAALINAVLVGILARIDRKRPSQEKS